VSGFFIARISFIVCGVKRKHAKFPAAHNSFETGSAKVFIKQDMPAELRLLMEYQKKKCFTEDQGSVC